MLVYPNPATDYATISYKALNVEFQLSYSLLTIEGKHITTEQLKNSQDEVLLDVSKIQSGQYILILKDGNRIIKSKKLTIKR